MTSKGDITDDERRAMQPDQRPLGLYLMTCRRCLKRNLTTLEAPHYNRCPFCHGPVENLGER